jgi:hypothetical protein
VRVVHVVCQYVYEDALHTLIWIACIFVMLGVRPLSKCVRSMA